MKIFDYTYVNVNIKLCLLHCFENPTLLEKAANSFDDNALLPMAELIVKRKPKNTVRVPFGIREFLRLIFIQIEGTAV